MIPLSKRLRRMALRLGDPRDCGTASEAADALDAALADAARLRAAIEAHRDANATPCDTDSCTLGCGHDRRLYASLEGGPT